MRSVDAVWDDLAVESARLPVGDGVILAIDQGSSSTRCIAYDAGLTPMASGRRRGNAAPGAGMVEHDPDELLAGALSAIAAARDGSGAGRLPRWASPTRPRRSCSGSRRRRAVTPVLSWQDQRAAGLCRALAADRRRHRWRP